MIIWITGLLGCGKSTLFYKIHSELGTGRKIIKDRIPFFVYEKKSPTNIMSVDIAMLGRTNRKRVLNGNDGIMCAKSVFMKFIDDEYPKHHHMIIEGNKFAKTDVFHHLRQYNLKVIHLKAPMEMIRDRSIKRNTGTDKKWTLKKWSNQMKRYEMLLNTTEMNDHVLVRDNVIEKDLDNICNEVMALLI